MNQSEDTNPDHFADTEPMDAAAIPEPNFYAEDDFIDNWYIDVVKFYVLMHILFVLFLLFR